MSTHVDHVPKLGEPAQQLRLRTIICVAAMSLLHIAHVFALVGSGMLAHPMTKAVGGGATQSVWFSSLITIMVVALNPPLSQVADYWGRKWVLVGTSAMGIVGAVILSRAQNFGTLMVGFSFMGVTFGSSSILMSVISEVLPRRHRPWGQGLGYMGGCLGGISGLLLGGSLLKHGEGGLLDNEEYQNYRIYWYTGAGIYTIATICCAVGYNPPPRNLQVSLKTSEKLRRSDWVGYLLFAPGLILFSMALAWTNNPYSWRDAHILAPFIIGISLMGVFIIYEWKLKTGILHHSLWHHRNFVISLFLMFVEGAAFFSVNSYFVRKLTIVYDETMLKSCVNFLIMFVTVLVATPVFGEWSSRFKVIRAPLLTGSAFLLLFFILIAIANSNTERIAFWIYPIIGGVGLASILPLSMVAAQMATPPELITLASSLMVSMRGFGGAVGIAVMNSIFNGTMKSELYSKVATAVAPFGLPKSSMEPLMKALASGSKGAIAAVPGITPRIMEASTKASKDAYSIAFRNVWLSSAAFCFVLVVLSFFLKEQKDEFTMCIDAPMELESMKSKVYVGSSSDSARNSDEEEIMTGTEREDAVEGK